MRNPWGHDGEWTGEWSDKDEASWTPAIKKELGAVDANDGVFFIPIDRYLDHFDETSVCFTVAEHLSVSEVHYSKAETACFEFELQHD